jgi:hypothetical protein
LAGLREYGRKSARQCANHTKCRSPQPASHVIAAAYAAKMKNVAEAAAPLQAVLTPEQQQKFDK